MGNSPSSPIDSSQLHRNSSSASSSGAKFTMVYLDTPALVYRPVTFQEAVDQARHTFQIPRYQPLEFSYKYLSVGYVTLTEHNWNAVMPTIHTLFITSQPPAPPSIGSSPLIAESKRLSPAPFSSSQTSHDLTQHSQSTEGSNVIPPSPLDPRLPTRPSIVTATAATAAVEPVTPSSPSPTELSIPPPVPSKSPLQRIRTPITPIRSPLGNKPLPTPPSGRPVNLHRLSMQSSIPTSPPTSPPPNSSPTPQPPTKPPPFSPPSISPSTDPSKVSFLVYHDDPSARNTLPEYRLIQVPKAYTIADLKDVLSDEFVMPAYLQELWIGGKMLEEDGDDLVLEAAGVTHGVVVVLSRAGVSEKIRGQG